MAFAPSNRFTGYDVLSMARELSKTIDVNKVLERQGKFFYEMSLLEIVTLLNIALDKSYLSYINAYAQDTDDDNTGIQNPELSLRIQSDKWINPTTVITDISATANLVCINLLQKRVTTVTAVKTIYDPLAGKQIDRIIGAEYRVEGAGATYAAVLEAYRSLGGMHKVEIEELQSLLRLDFKHASYKDDIVYTEMGGTKENAIKVGSETSWTAADSSCSDYLPATGTISSVYFPAYYLRLRADKYKIGTSGLRFKGTWESSSDYCRPFITIWYQRLPNIPQSPLTGSTAATDGWRPDSSHKSRFVDLPDKFIPLLVKRIYTYCLLQLNQSIPQQLSYDIMTDYNQIMAMMNSETQSKFGNPQLQQIQNQLGGR